MLYTLPYSIVACLQPIECIERSENMTVATVAEQTFQDCEKYALFDASGQVLASNFQVG